MHRPDQLPVRHTWLGITLATILSCSIVGSTNMWRESWQGGPTYFIQPVSFKTHSFRGLLYWRKPSKLHVTSKAANSSHKDIYDKSKPFTAPSSGPTFCEFVQMKKSSREGLIQIGVMALPSFMAQGGCSQVLPHEWERNE